ncbi:MAG: N-acetyltransferase family protein [Nitrososphaerales archaeon]
MSVFVRPYQPSDRAAVLAIAADTAFFGDPVEAYLEDRRVAQDFFVSYYLDCEPEHAWIAEADGVVVGYLTGSIGGMRATREKAKTALRAALRLVSFRYRIGPLSRRYALRAAKAAARGEYPHVDLKLYPAELHINLSPAARGLGLGRSLLNACLDQMAALHQPGIHLNTTSRNRAALRLYEKAGFALLGRHRSTVWEPWLPGEPVENLVYGKVLIPPRQAPKPIEP